MKANPIYNNYDEVFRHYVRRSNELILMHPQTLKTDCWNEAFRDPIALDGTTKILEYKQEHIDAALDRNPKLDIWQGDIRDIPFRDEKFDLVLDLSTLDHIPQEDIDKALSEYSRVLKTTGNCLIITWFTEQEYKPQEWNPDNQYFFNYETVKGIVNKYFMILEETNLLQANHPEYGKVTLYEFYLKNIVN